MYEIYNDNNLIYKPNEKGVALTSAKLSLEINNAGSFVFSVPATHDFYDSFEKFKSVITVYSDGEAVFCGRVIEESLDIFKTKTIYCEGELAILNDSIQRPSENHDITVRQFLEFLINNHNAQVEESKQFVVGAVTVTDSNDSLYRYTNYENTLQAIKEKLLDKLGGYISIRYAEGKRFIDYLADLPNTCTQAIRFGENLLNYSSNVNVTDIATRLIPLGATLEESQYTAIDERVTIESVNDGKDYIQSDEAVAQYGIITKIQTWDDVNVPSILLSKAREYLESVQWENMILNVTAVDMHQLNPEIEEIHIGDYILCISEVHGLRKNFPVNKLEIDLMNPANNKIQLGSKGDVSISTKTNQTSTSASEAIKTPVSSILQSAKDNASSLIKLATNGFVVMHTSEAGFPDELLIMDTPDIETAQKVWRWNSSGLGYSSTGYDGEYGLAMTMDGQIVADRITAGTLKGIAIESNNATITGGSINIETSEESRNVIRISNRLSDGTLSRVSMSAGGVWLYRNDNLVANINVGNGQVIAKRFGVIQEDGTQLNGAWGNFFDKYGSNIIVRNGIITKIES